MNFDYKGHELFISRMKDQISLVQNRNKSVVTSFLTPAQQNLLTQMCPADIHLTLWGGYEQAERKVACLSNYESDAYVSILKSSYDPQYKKLSHKDLLGALLHLGIEREQLGDLIVAQDCLLIFCTTQMCDFISSYLYQIGKVPVSFHPIDRVEIEINNRQSMKVNTASLRTDALVAALANISRSKAAAMIKGGLIKVNDVILSENKVLESGDYLSIRKVGRFQIKELQGTTRKGRFVFEVDKFI
jgi:RNA-binding protein YlmH